MKKTKEINISDIGRILTGNTPPRMNPEYYGAHTLFIKPTDISKDCKYTYSPEECYSELGYNKYKNSLVPKGATCVVTIGSIGEKLTKAHKPCFINQAMNAVVPNNNFDEDYVYYLLKHNIKQLKMFDSGTASGRENVSKSAFSSIVVTTLISKTEQEKVGKVLSNYDDLIENNNKRIKILEEMAQKIYKEWFVDFKFPGHETATFKDSELGKIPQNWTICPLKDILSSIKDTASKGEHLSSLRYLPIDCIPRKSFNLQNCESYKNAQSSLILFKESDILFGNMRSYFHKVILAPFDGITRTTCFVLRPKNKKILSWAYLTMFQDSTVSYSAQHSKGATIPYSFWDGGLADMETILPSNEIIEKFNKIIAPILKYIQQMYFKQNSLKQTRDILLPRLISGEIDVEDMEIK